MAFHYRPSVLEALSGHGIRPTAATEPELAHEFVNDLYRFELRRLRARYVRGDIPKRDYSNRVVSLRKQYIIISVPLRHWTIDDPSV